MSQQPPVGSAGTPEDPAGDPESTQRFDQSPYDVPESGPAADDTVAMSPPAYGQAPDPTRTIYSETTTTDPEGAPEDGEARRPRWVVPVVIAVILLLVIGGVAAAYFLGNDDEDPAPVVPTATEEATDGAQTPTPDATEEAEDATDEATEDATDGATAEATEEPTDEATEEAQEELLEDLEDSVSFENRATGEEITFTLGEDGFSADDDIVADGALEAWVGRYEAEDEAIDMLATRWPDNDAADAYAEELIEAIDGQEVETGHTYTTETGTYWAYLLEDGQGRYVWTTDRGHVLQVTGSVDHVSGFFGNYPL